MFSSNTTQVSSGGYQISRSLRFNSADSAYLSRSFGSNPNRKKYTISSWIKRSALGSLACLFASRGSPTVTRSEFQFESDAIFIGDNNGSSWVIDLYSTPVFRDVSAWYHFVLAVDTTQATSTDRVKFYVNNVLQTVTGTYPTQNYDTNFLITTATSYIGTPESSVRFFNGYMTEVNVIDGQALTPSSFGETNAQTGVWQPKAYSGSYGTNGFYLNFSDNSNTTAATLGKDYSGNGNNFTPNNFSVTAGAGNDSLVDTPTNYGTDSGAGGTVRGNYCTLNPLSNSAGTLSNGNISLAGTASAYTRCNATMAVSSGKWYFETTLTTAGSYTSVGIGQNFLTDQYPGQDALSYAQTLEQGSSINNNSQPAYGSTLTSGDVFMCAFDLDNNKIFFGKNGTWFGSSNPATGANPVYTLTAGTYSPIARPYSTGSVADFNFGQRPFAYTAPSGYKALCTQNLPTPTIGATTATQASQFFAPITYTGTGAANNNVTVGFQPDFIWIKNRQTAGYHHFLFDSVRGISKFLYSNLTNAEYTDANALTAINSNGFTLGYTTNADTNNSGQALVSWNWKANGAGVTNTAGSITSTVSANTTSGFSVVTYTGNGVNGATIGHGLGVAPKMIIAKSRVSPTVLGGIWRVYHAGIGSTKYLELNTTSAAGTYIDWANTDPTSSVFSVGCDGSYDPCNQSTKNYVAYCFAEVTGYSKFGSYTGNGSTDGPFIYCGFKPKYVMIKTAGRSVNWWVLDAGRNTYNVANAVLQPNVSDAEGTASSLDFLSNGFKIRTTDQAANYSGDTFIFAAFAETPFNYSLAR